jgi:ribonuclease P protein component
MYSPAGAGLFCSFNVVKQFSFGKQEKLKRRKQIDALFADGKSLTQFPVRLKYRFVTSPESEMPVQAGVSVSRKNFKRAVDRNRLKRLLREAYRLQKGNLLKTMAEKNTQVQLFLIYTDKTIASFAVVQEAVKKCLHQLQQKAQIFNENAD